MFKRILSLGAIVFALAGCNGTSVNPEAQKVVLSANPPPAGCRYISTITGNPGNVLAGGSKDQNAKNDIRNQAAKQGANYVQLTTHTASPNSVYTGNAYRCPRLP